MSTTKRDLDLLFEVGSLRNTDRSWKQMLGIDCANDVEHSFRVMLIALMLARREGGVDENKILKMALVHDLAETRTGDHNYTQKVYVTSDEEKAATDLFAGTILNDLREDILREYEERQTCEARIVKDADNLDVDVEIRELAERGSQMSLKWKESRLLVRNEKLYTQAAKDMWDAIQSADPSSWHLAANKWKLMPDAGK